MELAFENCIRGLGLSDSDPKKAEKWRDCVFTCNTQGSGMYTDCVVSSYSIQIKSIDNSESTSTLIDWNLLNRLTASKAINWCRTVRPLYPLRTLAVSADSDHCVRLLTAVSTAMWALDDVITVGKLKKRVHATFSEKNTWLRNRWLQMNEITDSGALLRTNVETSWQVICSAFGDSSDPIRRSSAVYGNDVIDPIHIFALSNVLRRPIVVLDGNDRSVKMGGRYGDSNDVCGVYLPVGHDSRTCCRSPVVLTAAAEHCVPLVFSAEMSPNVLCSSPERGVPLVDSNFTTLPVRCLLSPNDRPEVLISQYLRTTELPLTTTNTVNMVPVARIDTVEPPGEYNMITAWSNATKSQQHSNTPITVTPACHVTEGEQMAQLCNTTGCLLYGCRENDGLCSSCYSVRHRHSHVTPQLPVERLGSVECWLQSANEHRRSPECAKFGVMPRGTCAVQLSGRDVTEPEQLYYNEHLPLKVDISLEDTPVGPEAFSIQLCGDEPRQGQVGKCVAAGCEMYGLPERMNFCSQHYIARHLFQPQLVQTGLAQKSSSGCRIESCGRQGFSHYDGLCKQCFVNVGVPISGGPRPGQTRDSRHGDNLLPEAKRSKPQSSCIMDFCLNIGLVECKGLCSECFDAVCQTRLSTNNIYTPSATAIDTKLHGPVAEELKVTRCLMEGCRRPTQSEAMICNECLKKQQDAFAGLTVHRSI